MQQESKQRKLPTDGPQENSVSESVFRELAESASSAIFITDGKNLLYVNPACERVSGYSRDELLRLDLFNFVHPDSREIIKARAARRMRGKTGPIPIEMKILTKTGETRWLELTTGLVKFNDQLVMSGTAVDITERARARDVQEAVYKIAQAADQAESLDALFPILHQIISEVMVARNFYIALFDEQTQTISFPYFVDQYDQPFPPQKPGKGLTEYVLRTGKSLLVDMPMQEKLWETGDVVLIGEPSPIWLGVPLRVKEKAIGVMVVQHYTDPTVYGENEQKILEFVSSQVAVVIDRKRSEDALRRSEERYHRRVVELTALYETTRELAAQHDLNALLNIIADRVTELLDTPGCSIYLFHPEQEELEAVISRGLEDIVGTRLKIGEGLTGKVAATLQPMKLSDHRTWDERAEKFSNMPVTSVVEVPMLYSGELVGVLSVYRLFEEENGEIHEFTDADTNLLTVFAGAAASAVHNARLFEETRQRLLELEVLYQASLPSTQIHSLTALAQRVVETLDQFMNWHRVSIWVVDEVRRKPVLLARYSGGLSSEELKVELERVDGLITNMQQGFIGWVCTHGKAINDGNVQTNPMYMEYSPDVRSELCVPLRIGGRTIGCINVESTHPDAFSDHDERLLSTLAGQTAIAIENARLYQDALLSSERRSILYQASQEIARASQDIELVSSAVHRAASQLMPCDAFVITLVDDARQEIHGVYLFDRGVRHPSNVLRYGEGISWRVITTGKALHYKDFEKADDGIVRHTFGQGGRARSLLAVPLRAGEKVIGMISAQSYKPDVYTDDDAVLLETIGANAGVAIENARLFEDTRQRAVRQAALNDIIIASSRSGTDLQELLKAALEQSLHALRLNLGAVWLTLKYQSKPSSVVEGLLIEDDRDVIQVLDGISADIQRSETVVDWEQDQKPYAQEMLDLGLRSSIFLPVISGGQRAGGLLVGSVASRFWQPDEISFIESVGRELGAAADRLRLFEETRVHMVELEGVNRVSIALRQAQTRDEMMPLLMAETMNALDVSDGGIWLFDPATQLLRQAIGRGWCLHTFNVDLKKNEGIIGRVFQSGDIYFSRDLARDPELCERSRDLVPQGWSGLCVPIMAEQESIGALFISAALPRDFNPENARLLVTIAEIAGNAIHRMALHERTQQHAIEMETRVLERTAELQTALQKAQEADRLKSEFIANVNHELRTPLTNLVLYYQMLRAQPTIRTEERMDVIGRELQRLRVLIEDLLNLSRLDLGQTSFHMLPHDVNSLIRTLVDDRRSLAEERKLKLVTELTEDLPLVTLDENLISQAFSNLLTNAMRYTSEMGTVRVSTRLLTKQGERQVGLRVDDSGPGIDAQDLPHLFDRFYRGKVGQRSGAHGTGLGLAIVKSVVSKHHGTIDVDPGGVDGRGAAFTIWLPIKQNQETG